MMADSALVNELNTMLIGRIPIWYFQAVEVQTGAGNRSEPSGTSGGLGGVPLLDSPRTRLLLDTQRNSGKVYGYYVINTADINATYTVELDAETVTYDGAAGGAASTDDLYRGLLAALQGNATLDAAGYEFSVRENSNAEAVELLWSGPLTMAYVAASASGAVADVTGFCEAASFGYQVWATAKQARGTRPPPTDHWFRERASVAAHTADPAPIVDTAGLERLYVQPLSVVANANADASIVPLVYVYIGPASADDIRS